MTPSHLRPVGKPPPPRPRSPDAAISRTVASGPMSTALSGLAVDRPDVVWVAAAIAEEDQAMAAEHPGQAFTAERDGGSFRVRLVENDPEAHHRFYAIIANPILWFIQHYLWDLSNAPDIRRTEIEAWDHGYKDVNTDIAEAVLGSIEDQSEPLVMFHDYHLYTAPGVIRAARPDAFL